MSNIKIEGALTGSLDIKRFYMPGIKITVTCPECGDERSQDMGARYIGYPTINEPIEHNLYCPICEHEWSESVFLAVSYYVLDETAIERNPRTDALLNENRQLQQEGREARAKVNRLRGAIADCVGLDTISPATASRLLAIVDGFRDGP